LEAIRVFPGKYKAVIMAVLKEKPGPRRCIVCEGALERSNIGNVCNQCKDKMRK
jgi:hypothetical protein